MSPHKYFVQVADKNSQVLIQEIEPKLFSFLQLLPSMDVALNEPNLLKLERYPSLGLVQTTSEIQTFYGGVARMSDNSLIMMFHYFLVLRPTKLQNHKKKPYFLSDYEAILNSKASNGDSRNKR